MSMQPVRENIPPESGSSFFCQRQRLAGIPFKWHTHEAFELTLMIRGFGKRFVGDSIADFYEGDLVLLGPNLPHAWYTWFMAEGEARKLDDQEFIQVQFAPDLLGESLLRCPELSQVGKLLKRASLGIKVSGATRLTVGREILQLEREDGMRRLVRLFTILDELARSRELETLASPNFMDTSDLGDQDRIEQVYHYINLNYREEIRLEDVANLVHMTPSAFSRFFKRRTTKTLTQYINELRIGRACALLMESDLSISEVCYQAGFNNLSYFNRTFQKHKEMTPKQYRRALRRDFSIPAISAHTPEFIPPHDRS